jgi:hypothetical protein
MPVPVQVIPPVDPSNEKYYEPEIQFDNQRVHRSQDDKLAVSDFSRLRILKRKVQRQRRLSTPEWASDDLLLRELLVRYLEHSARLFKPGDGSYKERLDRADRALKAEVPQLRECMVALAREHHELSRARKPDEERLRRLSIEIQNLDTRITIIERGVAAVVAAVVYSYYRLGRTSVEVAEEYRLKSSHVYQILFKLNQLSKSTK